MSEFRDGVISKSGSGEQSRYEEVPSKKKRAKKSYVYKYFEFNEETQRFHCKHCGTSYQKSRDGSTASLRRHFRTKHADLHEENGKDVENSLATCSQTGTFNRNQTKVEARKAVTRQVVPFRGNIDEEWLERSDHPLLNDLILKLLFERVRRFDLKACRGVCKKWNLHTLPYMRSTFEVKIYGRKSEERSRRVVDFVKLFKSNELGIPFEKYCLGPICTTDEVGKQFLDICGGSIKEIVLFQPHDVENYVRRIENVSELLKCSPKLETLSLRGEFVSRSRNIVRLFPDSAPVLPALKKLTLELDSRKSAIKYCPSFFDELLSVGGNISDIAIVGLDNVKLTTLVLNSIEKLGKESSIQALSLELDYMTSEHLEILKRMAARPNGLKLKEIHVVQKENSTVQVELSHIFKDTLEVFDLINLGTRRNQVHLMTFPFMSKLKSFKFNDMDVMLPRPVGLNKIFPVLETLCVSSGNVDYGYGDTGFAFFSQFEECPTVKEYTMFRNYTYLPALNNVLRVFPNLIKLTLNILEDTKVFQLIWTRMTQLESLTLFIITFPTDVMEMDSLVTGISIQRLNEISQVIPELARMTFQHRRDTILNLLEEHKTQEPSIRNLTALKHLYLEVNAGWKSKSCLSDLTGYFGIYVMKRLINLDIRHCKFTKPCCEILTKETGIESWRFRTDFRPSEHIIRPFGISDGKN